MGAMASLITSLTIVYSTVYSGTDHRKHQSSASLAFVRGIHRWPVNSSHKGPVTRKMFPFDDVIMDTYIDTCLLFGNKRLLDPVVRTVRRRNCAHGWCHIAVRLMTTSNGNIFRVTGHLCGEFTGHRWIPRTKASAAELCCFLWSAPETNRTHVSWDVLTTYW